MRLLILLIFFFSRLIPFLLRLFVPTYIGIVTTLAFAYGAGVLKYMLNPFDMLPTYLGMIDYWKAYKQMLSPLYAVNIIVPPAVGFLIGLLYPYRHLLMRLRKRKQRRFHNVRSTSATTIDGVYTVIDVNEPKV